MIIFLGVLAGLAFGLTGVGGSLLALPLLIIGLGLAPHAAIPVGLAAITLAAAVAAGDGARTRLLKTGPALVLALPAALSAPLGVLVAGRVSAEPLSVGFAVLAVAVAIGLWRVEAAPGSAGARRAALAGAARERDLDPGWSLLTPATGFALGGCGFAAGLIGGVFGVGTGFVLVPALLRLAGMARTRAVATSLLAIVVMGLSAVSATYVLGRDVPWYATGLFVLGAVAGVGFARRVPVSRSGAALPRAIAIAVAASAVAVPAWSAWGLR